MKNNSSRPKNPNSFHTDRDRERDGDGGGFYSGHATGSPPTNISSPTSSFYNLQMYSTPTLYTAPTTPTAVPIAVPTSYHQPHTTNLYQSVQEVPYHPPLDHRPYPVRSTPSPSASNGSSSSSGMEYNKVHKNGITFVDPFTAPTNTNEIYYQQQQQFNSQKSSSNRNNTSISNNNVRINCEPVIQPIYATFGTESIFVTCPYCHNTDSTEIEQVVGSEAILWACIIPFAGFLRKKTFEYPFMSSAQNSHNVIIINAKPPPVLEPSLTDLPTLLTCPYCTTCVTTKTSHQNGAFTFLAVGCFATCCLCCIPLISTRFKDVKHECPTCTSEIGIFRRIGQ